MSKLDSEIGSGPSKDLSSSISSFEMFDRPLLAANGGAWDRIDYDYTCSHVITDSALSNALLFVFNSGSSVVAANFLF